jgi:hypothetical protein
MQSYITVHWSSRLDIQTSLTEIMRTRTRAEFYVAQHLLTMPMQVR